MTVWASPLLKEAAARRDLARLVRAEPVHPIEQQLFERYADMLDAEAIELERRAGISDDRGPRCP
jgi:hypothetical protein